MCRTIESSLFTFLLTLTVGCYLLGSKPYLAKILFLLGSMQLIDAILWYSIYTKNLSLNKLVSKYCIPLVLSLQLIIGYYSSSWRNHIFEFFLLLQVLIFSMWYQDCTITTIAKDGYLKWCDFIIKDIHKILYLILIIFPIYNGLPDGFDKDIVLSSIIITFIYNHNNEAFGSKWCYSVNIISIFVLMNQLA